MLQKCQKCHFKRNYNEFTGQSINNISIDFYLFKGGYAIVGMIVYVDRGYANRGYANRIYSNRVYGNRCMLVGGMLI